MNRGAIMKKILLGAIALLAMLAGPAGAADMRAPVLKAPPPPPAYWDGFYLGLNAGYGWGRTSSEVESFDPATAALFAQANHLRPELLASSFRQSGGIAGVQAGYNWQLSPTWVAGIETDFQYARVRGSSLTTAVIDPTAPYLNVTQATLQWFGTMRGRLGFLATPSLLIYGTGGLAYGRTEASGTVTLTAPVGPVGDFIVAGNSTFSCQTNTQKVCYTGAGTQTSLGWAAGGGFEHMITPNLTAKLEYLHVELPGQTVTLVSPPPSVNAFVNYRFSRESVDLIRVGLNYKFGWTTGLPGPGR
jgi:outer membrane immunogenic protein